MGDLGYYNPANVNADDIGALQSSIDYQRTYHVKIIYAPVTRQHVNGCYNIKGYICKIQIN